MQLAKRVRAAMAAAAVGCALGVTLGACSDEGEDTASSAPTTTSARDTELRAELIGMLERDQAQRAGRPVSDETDRDRTERLKEIIEEHGWPGYDLVGKKGEDAAWAIAQHSDLDPVFQAEALELLRAAVAQGQASPGNLAYLEDRVAVGQGRPQTYGTQMGCASDGPEPATPIADAEKLDELRARVGLEPIEEYLVEMRKLCATG